MSIRIPFTGNYSDLSNNEGYQFEFRCERCGNGFRSGFQRDIAATGQKFVRSLSHLVGYGKMYRVTSAADRLLDRSTNSEAKDKALTKAVEEVSPHFHQCRGCGDWVCDDGCWNDPIGQCVRCSPNQAHELAQLQAQARRDQMREGLRNVNLVDGVDLGQQSSTRCPSCGTHAAGGRFCTACGSSLAQEVACRGCSHGNPIGAIFCRQCGHSLT